MKCLKYIYTRVFLLGIVAAVLCGCSHDTKYRIGVSQCSADDWRTKMNEEILREALLHDNIEVEIRSADDSSDKQIADLEYFLDNDFDIIVVAPNEADALTPKIREIYDKGMPVVLFDRTIHGDTYTAFQGADNEEIGRMVAALAATYSAQPRVIEIMGLKGSSPAELRHKGFRHGADSLGITVLGQGHGNWNYECARTLADSLLEAHPQANIIYAHNDRMAIAAKDAAMAKGRGDIKIIGVDAAPNIGIKAVTEGKIDATFLYPTHGNQLIRTALAILEGEPWQRNTVLPTAAPVDMSNADILLLQNQVLRDETEKISYLQGKVKTFTAKYSTQTTILYGLVIIMLLLAGVIFLLLRWYWSSKQHHREMQQRNEDLARQRDELDMLYHQLEEAMGSKLAWFTNVSHDLRTPLTLISDPVHQIAGADNLTPSQKTRMQLADKNVKRLERLVNQILDIRKYDSGVLRLNLVNVDLVQAVGSWVASFADLAAKRHISLKTTAVDDAKVVTAIDIEKTERIFFNLLSNAFKFTPENGRINVSFGREGDNAVIRVADTGRGIPPEDIDHIFERFFRTETVNPNGSGIGLALSKVFIDMHGGSIKASSNVGEGTVFTVTLPIHTVDAVSSATVASNIDVAEIEDVAEEEVEVTENSALVLVIDDNKDICTLVRSILSDDYTVVTANSGAQGIRMANKYVPDLVICDVMMPGTNGYDVCRAIKADPLTAHIPVLLLTACGQDEQRLAGYDCGADAYMSKPFESPMLRGRCKSLVENRRLIYQNLDSKPAPAASEAAKEKAQKGGVDDEFMQRFIAAVEADISDQSLSVESLADRLGLSRVQMYRKVKAITNYSAAEMIRNIRLKQAATMLKTRDVTVSEVAYAVGFSSPSYFSRCYKDYFNESPLDTQNRTAKRK